jgi:chromosome segregation ATPase
MDKTKTKFVIAIAVLAVVCIALIGYAASVNAQLSAEKIKAAKFSDQIAGLNAKAKDLETQLTSTTAQADNQANLVNSMQSSLNASNAELEKLKTSYTELESKLKSEISSAASRAEQAVTGAVSSAVPAKQ